MRSGKLSGFILVVAAVAFGGSNARASWLQSTESGGIAYFLHNGPGRILRYDMTLEQWLSPLTIGGVPTAFAVDQQGIYVSFGQATSRFALDGTGQTGLHNSAFNVSQVLVRGPYLYLIQSSSGVVSSVDKTTGTEIDEVEFNYPMVGVSIAPTLGKLFGRSSGVSRSDIVQVTLGADGSLGSQNDSPYHGDYPGASRTYVFPGEARVADSSGIVYNTNNLTFANGLGGSFDDLSFYGDLPIVLRGNTLFAYNNAFLPTGQHTASVEIDRIFVHKETVYGFAGTTQMTVVATSVDALSPPRPGEPIDPNGLSYAPSHVALGTDGVVYLLSSPNLSIFRWSIAEKAYLPTIPLAQAPTFMAYSPVSQRLYLAYSSGLLTRIDLDGELTEVPFAGSPQTPCGLATAGEFLFVCDPIGEVSHFTYHPDGSLISQVENYYSTEYIWNAQNRRMYFFRDNTTPNDLHWEGITPQGVILGGGQTPYHTSTGIVHPIRVSPDGAAVVLGSGWIFDGLNLTHDADLSNSIADADWLNGQLFTLRSTPPYAEIQRWATLNYLLEHSFAVSGTPIRLFALDDELLILSSVNGVPRFWLRGPDAGDIDRDGAQDHLDNCPEQANSAQADTDSDSIGDACNDALDADGDEWADILDNCPALANPDQSDGDSDELGDACDLYPLHDLHIVLETPEWGLTTVPLPIVFRLEDSSGRLVSELSGVRATLALGGSATFGAAAAVGQIVSGAYTNQALVEFAGGLVQVEVVDLVAETVVVNAIDSEAIGITLDGGFADDFEADDGGFTHAGPNDTWAHGVPTWGPGAAYSGTKVWATNLSGNYLNNSDCSLYSPAVPLPASGGSLEFQSWFDGEFCCDRGYVEVSANGGLWIGLDTLFGFEGGYHALAYDLSAFANSTVVVRLRLATDSSTTDRGWYVDDFAIAGAPNEIRFIELGGDEDGDGSPNEEEIARETDPFDSDTDDDGILDGADNCALTLNPSQLDVVHPNGVGDACEDPDGDGVVDGADNCPDTANADQLDSVHPGAPGDACADPDGDGRFDLTDNCPDAPNADQADPDGDLVGSACDICPATSNPAQTENAACIALGEPEGPCLEAEIELIGRDVSGEVRIYGGVSSVPQSLTLDILATSCFAADTLRIALNGELLGDPEPLDPGLHCSCLSPIQHVTFDEDGILQALWRPEGPNVLELSKNGNSSAVGWVRLTLEGEGGAQNECVYSNGSTGCALIDVCAGGYNSSPFVHHTELTASTELLNAVPFEGSLLPGLVDLGDAGAGSALCVFTDRAGGSDCLPLAPRNESLVAINGAACDVVAGTDLVVDFGPGVGIWGYHDDLAWSPLHDLSPEQATTGDLDGDGEDESVFCFGGDAPGLYVWSAARGWWPRLLPACGGPLATGDLDANGQDELIVDLGGTPGGLYVRFNDTFWMMLHGLSAEQLATADLDGSARDELIVDFGAGFGLYVLYDATSWVQLHALSPESVTSGDLDGAGGDDLIVDFGSGFGLGLFAYRNDAFWTSVHPLSSELVTLGDLDAVPGDELVVDFGEEFGLWLHRSDSSWVNLHALSPKLATTGDLDASGKEELIVDFGAGAGLGIYVYRDNGSWSWLHPLSSELLVPGELD